MSGMRTVGLTATLGAERLLDDVSLELAPGSVTAIIGPSGCGKSTLLRCLNRMHELAPGASQRGRIELDGQDLMRLDPVAVRRRVGMIFHKPNPFPSMSVRENVSAGLRLSGRLDRPEIEVVEEALRAAELWDELKDRLDQRATSLAPGEQQRLCIARSLAIGPEVLLLDEPSARLDPAASAKIEDLLHGLRARLTIVLVTHNVQQAARVSDHTAFLLEGRLVELAATDKIFTTPKDRRTEDFITGKFG